MKKLLKYSDFFILPFLLVISAFLRLYKIADYMTFLGDEGRDVLVVYNILHGHPTLLGPTSSVGGFFLGPIYYYFMAPFLWLFNYNPVGPAVMIGILGTITVLLVYKIGSEFFGKTAGFIAATLYAISPLVIAYSRSSWNPNPMPFFTLLTMYTLYKALQKNSLWLFALVGILYGIDMQLHYIEIFVGVIIGVSVFIMRFFLVKGQTFAKLKSALKDYASIFVGFIVGLSPFLAFELRHSFPDVKSITNFIFHSPDTGGGGNFLLIIGSVLFRLFGRLITKFPPPEQISVSDSKITLDLFITSVTVSVSVLYVFTLLIAIPSVIYLIYRTYQSISTKQKNYMWYVLLSLWLFIGVFLFGFYKKPIYDYYFQFMFPVPFLLFGALFSFLYFQKKVLLKILCIIVFLVLIVLNLSGIPFRYSPNRQLEQAQTIAKFVYDKTRGKPYNFAIGGEGNSDHAYRYFFTLWGHPPVEIQHQGDHGDPTTVTDQILIVCERPPCHPLGEAKWEIAGFGRAEIAQEWDVSVARVYKLVHYKGK